MSGEIRDDEVLTPAVSGVVLRQSGLTLPATSDPPERWPTSLDLSTPEGQVRMVSMSGPPKCNWEEALGRTWEIVEYAMRPEERVKEDTGEVEQYTQLTLLASDGTTLGTPGPVAIKKWILAMRLRGIPSEGNPITIVPLKSPSRRKGRYYDDLELVPPE